MVNLDKFSTSESIGSEKRCSKLIKISELLIIGGPGCLKLSKFNISIFKRFLCMNYDSLQFKFLLKHTICKSYTRIVMNDNDYYLIRVTRPNLKNIFVISSNNHHNF